MSTLMIIQIDLSNKLVNSYMIQEIILILYLPFQNTYHLTDSMHLFPAQTATQIHVSDLIHLHYSGDHIESQLQDNEHA